MYLKPWRATGSFHIVPRPTENNGNTTGNTVRVEGEWKLRDLDKLVTVIGCESTMVWMKDVEMKMGSGSM